VSSYFETLKRLKDAERSAATGAALESHESVAWIDAQPALGFAVPDGAAAGLGDLLDALRAIDSRFPQPRIVLSAASPHEPCEELAANLITHAARRGVRISVASLSVRDGRRQLQPLLTATPPDLPPLVLGAEAETSAIDYWFAQAGKDKDLILLLGPPLSSSVDGALLARHADGLVVIVRLASTRSQLLQAATERARSTGCRVLGLIVVDSPEVLPHWLQSLLPRRSWT
jgi:hypothetical protein